MYSKPLLRKYIDEGLHLKGWSEKYLAEKIGSTPSNLARALNSERSNLTLIQFAEIVKLLELTSEQTYHILTGKKEQEAKLQALISYAKKIVDGL
jgi:transcriptional regulator with XRE-family HTH domain